MYIGIPVAVIPQKYVLALIAACITKSKKLEIIKLNDQTKPYRTFKPQPSTVFFKEICVEVSWLEFLFRY